MQRRLDYATQRYIRDQPEPSRLGRGLLNVFNLLCLLVSLLVLAAGASRDGYGGMFAVLIGGLAMLMQLLIGGIPACVYFVRHHALISRGDRIVLLSLAAAPPVISGTGIVLACLLPATHGTC